MILNLLMSLIIVVIFITITCFVSLIIVKIIDKSISFVKRKKEKIGLEKWYRIDDIIRSTLLLSGIIILLTFFVYTIIFK